MGFVTKPMLLAVKSLVEIFARNLAINVNLIQQNYVKKTNSMMEYVMI